MIEFYVGDAGIKFQNIEDIKYIIDESLEEEVLDFFLSLLDMQVLDFLGISDVGDTCEENGDDYDDFLGFNLGE